MTPLYRAYAVTNPLGNPRVEVVAGRESLNRARRIGLLPGSFNPLTLAHTALAETARRSAELDLIVLAIAAQTVDKEGVTRAAVPDRLGQLAAYARSAPELAVVLVNRGLYVEQADALSALVAGTAEIAIIVGFDKVVQILDPHYYVDRDAALSELFTKARLLAAPRLDDDRPSLTALLAQPENSAYAERITYLDLPPRYRTDSATGARRLLASADESDDIDEVGATAREIVPPEAYALARLGPYTPSQVEQRDRYATRVLWLEVLCSLDDAQLAALPPLDALVAATLADGVDARALRARLNVLRSRHAPVDVDTLNRLIARFLTRQP